MNPAASRKAVFLRSEVASAETSLVELMKDPHRKHFNAGDFSLQSAVRLLLKLAAWPGTPSSHIGIQFPDLSLSQPSHGFPCGAVSHSHTPRVPLVRIGLIPQLSLQRRPSPSAANLHLDYWADVVLFRQPSLPRGGAMSALEVWAYRRSRDFLVEIGASQIPAVAVLYSTNWRRSDSFLPLFTGMARAASDTLAGGQGELQSIEFYESESSLQRASGAADDDLRLDSRRIGSYLSIGALVRPGGPV